MTPTVYDESDEYACMPSVILMDGCEWRLAYVSTTATNGRFYVRHDGVKWHLWFPTMGDRVIAVENCAMLGVTY